MTDLVEKEEKITLKTFSIHETDLSFVRHIKPLLFQYKHVENMLNILLQQQFNKNQEFKNNNQEAELIIGKELFNLLLNPVIMKAVLNGNTGGIKTKETIDKVNDYFSSNELLSNAKQVAQKLNDKNISMIIRRIKKDWSNYFTALAEYSKNSSEFIGKPSYPKAKKLSQVFQYSVPLEPDKFSLKRSSKGLFGITLGKKMFYVSIGNSSYFKGKIVNNVTVSYSHGHIYYNFTYSVKKEKLIKDSKEKILPYERIRKEAGGDIGLNNLISLFIHDLTSQSLVISGKELISYNCYFNKQVAELNELISKQVKVYREITDKKGIIRKVPETYTYAGKRFIKRKSQLFERRRLFFADYMNKMSKKILTYLSYHEVTDLVLSKNLSFTKTDGSIDMNKKTKQKFYQIPFGSLLNMLEQKVMNYNIGITWINEAYTSKTSSLTANVVAVQDKAVNKETIVPNDLNGNRGAKKKENTKNRLGRGLFKDKLLNKVINADINAACNHVKVGFKSINNELIQKMSLSKFCNPIKIKSNHEFDTLLKRLGIVARQLGNGSKEICYLN